MDSFDNILHKLSAFISRYYKARMIKGAFLFMAMAVVFWILLLTLEYFLWLGNNARLVLYLTALVGTTLLLYHYLGIPLFQLLRIQKGLSMKRAAWMIGTHFPIVGDRLVNLLDLASDKEKSELLLASIEQRSKELSPVPFWQAIDLGQSLKYARLLLIPLLLLVALWISGKAGDYLNSLDRMVHYDAAYERPAPFQFSIVNTSLQTLENQDFTLYVLTEGELRPEFVQIVIEGKERTMREEQGRYTYTFTSPDHPQEFYFRANGVRSRNYVLQVMTPPSIQEFITVLDYPLYTEKKSDTLRGTGNAVVPEGTKAAWLITALNTDQVRQITKDTVINFRKIRDEFKLMGVLNADLSYDVSTSNKNLPDFERLSYSINVLKDTPPGLKVIETRDTLTNTVSYEGRAMDDYGIEALDLIYYEEGKEEEKEALRLDKPRGREYVFTYDFPNGLELVKGKVYNYYFQVRDNDALHGGKIGRSEIFSTAILDQEQESQRLLQEQKEAIRDFDINLDKMGDQEEILKELERNQKERNVLDFNDKKAIGDFLKSQQEQEALMKKFSKELKETISNGENEGKVDRLLKERLERQEMEARKNEKLLEELRNLADKMDKEELAKRLEQIGKGQRNSKRNLEQLLELTKRYYVTEKANELSRRLNELGEKEEILSDTNKDPGFNQKEQEKINEQFEKMGNELDDLRKSNEELSKPLPIDTEEELEKEISEDLTKALEEIKKDQKGEGKRGEQNDDEGDKSTAKENQKKAAAKMKKMAESLQQSAMGAGGMTMAEDAEMLRQILENVIIFSLKQESLLDKVNEDRNGQNYSVSIVREEQQLRSLFEHVDDSLFALSLRQAEITEFVNEQITEVYYNIESSLENLAEGEGYRAAAHQQSVITAANSLADFLADVLSNMQQSLAQGQGSGKSQDGFQLPDIIKGQKDIQEGMGKMGEQNQEGKGKEGEGNEGDGKGTREEKQGNKGDNTGDGNSGEEEMAKLYEIYKQQQMIRKKLEQQLENLIDAEERDFAERLVRQMEDFEKDLLDNGITQRTMNKVNRIQQQLMRLENAAMEQGEKKERESNRPSEDITRPLIKGRSVLGEDGIMEILQRQGLPLQEFYDKKAKRYFWEYD